MAEFLLPESDWPAMPDQHRAFLVDALPTLRGLDALCGVAAGGSFLSGQLDRYSDLDLLVAVAERPAPLSRSDREQIAASIGPLLAAFPGDHVHEPRLLICLFGPPLLHVDLKFLPIAQFNPRVEDPIVLWDRDGEVTRTLAAGVAAYPSREPQWIEDRFWVWVHYVATKIGRGELFEALDSLGALRRMVLGPLALQRGGARPDGVRRVEQLPLDVVSALRATVASYDRESCYRALVAVISMYRELRATLAPSSLARRSAAETEAVAYLEGVGRFLGIHG